MKRSLILIRAIRSLEALKPCELLGHEVEHILSGCDSTGINPK